MSGVNYRSRSFQAFASLAGQITVISLKANNPSKEASKSTGPALSRINSVIIPSLTQGRSQ